jgi:hypothetical protein
MWLIYIKAGVCCNQRVDFWATQSEPLIGPKGLTATESRNHKSSRFSEVNLNTHLQVVSSGALPMSDSFNIRTYTA